MENKVIIINIKQYIELINTPFDWNIELYEKYYYHLCTFVGDVKTLKLGDCIEEIIEPYYNIKILSNGVLLTRCDNPLLIPNYDKVQHAADNLVSIFIDTVADTKKDKHGSHLLIDNIPQLCNFAMDELARLLNVNYFYYNGYNRYDKKNKNKEFLYPYLLSIMNLYNEYQFFSSYYRMKLQ